MFAVTVEALQLCIYQAPLLTLLAWPFYFKVHWADSGICSLVRNYPTFTQSVFFFCSGGKITFTLYFLFLLYIVVVCSPICTCTSPFHWASLWFGNQCVRLLDEASCQERSKVRSYRFSRKFHIWKGSFSNFSTYVMLERIHKKKREKEKRLNNVSAKERWKHKVLNFGDYKKFG